jgi:hypothetical protein
MAGYQSPIGSALQSFGGDLMQILMQREVQKRQAMLDALRQRETETDIAARTRGLDLQERQIADRREAEANQFSYDRMQDESARNIREQRQAATETERAKAQFAREGALSRLNPDQRSAFEQAEALGGDGLAAIAPPKPAKPETYNVGGDLYERTPDGQYRKVVSGYREPKADPGMKPPTDGQNIAAGFADRMDMAEGIVRQFEQDAAGMLQSPLSGRFAPDWKKSYQPAMDNWIAANLRKESGAAISADEYAGARAQYFPQPGDTDAVIQQKRELRAIAAQSMRRASGTANQGSAPAGAPMTRTIRNSRTGETRQQVSHDGGRSWQ